MTNQFTNPAVAYLRNKLAAAGAEAMHEGMESPEQEALEHAGGAGEGEEAHEEGGIEQLLAQLSPEELEQLAAELGGDIQDPNATQGGEDVASLAHAIASHLGQTPEANPAISDPEKQAAFEFVKSASYIHGFINQAMHDGVGVKTAVDLYDSSLTETIKNLKTAELKGGQHKLDINKDGKIDGSDLKKLRYGKKQSLDSKTAAYYDGVFERAREYGISDHTTAAVIKAASVQDFAQDSARRMHGVRSSPNPDFLPGLDEGRQQAFQAANSFAQRQALNSHPEIFEGPPLSASPRLDNLLGDYANPSHSSDDPLIRKLQAMAGGSSFPDAGGLASMVEYGNPDKLQLGGSGGMDELTKKLLGRDGASLSSTPTSLSSLLDKTKGDSSAFSPQSLNMVMDPSEAKGMGLGETLGLERQGPSAPGIADKAKQFGSSALDYLKQHAPEAALIGGGALAGGAGLMALRNHLKKKKQKEEGDEAYAQ